MSSIRTTVPFVTRCCSHCASPTSHHFKRLLRYDMNGTPYAPQDVVSRIVLPHPGINFDIPKINSQCSTGHDETVLLVCFDIGHTQHYRIVYSNCRVPFTIRDPANWVPANVLTRPYHAPYSKGLISHFHHPDQEKKIKMVLLLKEL